MFDLRSALRAWRLEMTSDEAVGVEELAELESHLLEAFDALCAGEYEAGEAYRILALAFGAESRRAIRVAIKLGSLHAKLGSYADGERLMRELLANPSLPRRPRPSALAVLAQNLLGQEKFKEAETALLESVELRRKSMPKSWLLRNSVSMLGESLAGQSRYEEAEAMLLEAYETMQPPKSSMGQLRKREALERIVRLYEAWGKPTEAVLSGGEEEGGRRGRLRATRYGIRRECVTLAADRCQQELRDYPSLRSSKARSLPSRA